MYICVNTDPNFKIILKFYHPSLPLWLTFCRSQQQFLPNLLQQCPNWLWISTCVLQCIYHTTAWKNFWEMLLHSLVSNPFETLSSHLKYNPNFFLWLLRRRVFLNFLYWRPLSILWPSFCFILIHRLYHHLKLCCVFFFIFCISL